MSLLLLLLYTNAQTRIISVEKTQKFARAGVMTPPQTQPLWKREHLIHLHTPPLDAFGVSASTIPSRNPKNAPGRERKDGIVENLGK